MLFLYLTPTLPFESRFRIFIINGYYTKTNACSPWTPCFRFTLFGRYFGGQKISGSKYSMNLFCAILSPNREEKLNSARKIKTGSVMKICSEKFYFSSDIFVCRCYRGTAVQYGLKKKNKTMAFYFTGYECF